MRYLLVAIAIIFIVPLHADGIVIFTKDGSRHDWFNWYETKSKICKPTDDGVTCISKKKIVKIERPKPKNKRKSLKEAVLEKTAIQKALEKEKEKQGEPLTEKELTEQFVQTNERLEEMELRLQTIEEMLRNIEILLLPPPEE
jgi:hypothetical protein